MNESQAFAFCTDLLDAWNTQDSEKLITLYGAYALYRDPATPKGLLGHHEILPYFKQRFCSGISSQCQLLEVFPTNQGFFFKWRAFFKTNQNAMICEEGLDLIELDMGQISRHEVFFDLSSLRGSQGHFFQTTLI